MTKIACGAVLVLLLSGCADPEPEEWEIQIAHGRCFAEMAPEVGESAAIECSDELMQIGARAFVEKYATPVEGG